MAGEHCPHTGFGRIEGAALLLLHTKLWAAIDAAEIDLQIFSNKIWYWSLCLLNLAKNASGWKLHMLACCKNIP